MLELQQCQKFVLDGQQRRCLIDLDQWSAKRGEIHLCYGPSGSGKTTFLEVCSGLTQLDRGQVMWDERTITTTDDYNGNLCYLPVQSCLFDELSVMNNMRFMLSMKEGGTVHQSSQDSSVIMDVLASVGLGYIDVNMSPAQCSSGEKMRLSLCRALLQCPELLILDEPTANLDSALSAEIFDLLVRETKRRKMLVIMASHDALAQSICDGVIEMHVSQSASVN